MHHKKMYLPTLLLLATVLSLAFTITPNAQTANQPQTLQSVEITEYQGQDLSSIRDFLENSIKGPQHIDQETYRLDITGLVNQDLQYTYNQILSDYQSYKKVVSLHCVEGWSVTILWEGVLVKDLLAHTQIAPEANTVIFYAYDGYSTALPLEYIIDNNIMIAYKMNNVTLPPERGFPFQLVAESKAGYKWIKWLTQIEISADENYLGYWETRGWPNNADVSGPVIMDTNGGYYITPAPTPADDPDEIPEFPSLTFVPLLVAATVVLILYRKRLTKKLQ